MRITAADTKEYIPYALESKIEEGLSTCIRLLFEHMMRYSVQGEKISSYQLPKLTPQSRPLYQHLRTNYPHLHPHMLHHWCAQKESGLAFQNILMQAWNLAWRQDRHDVAPWTAAVNILMVKIIRGLISNLQPEEANIDLTENVMISVIGGAYSWLLQNFLKNSVQGEIEVTRIATYESMIIPVTPMAFMYRQLDGVMLMESRHVILSYGLEPELIPRMQELRKKLGNKNEAGMLGLLGQIRMSDHLLQRSWARLCLWELAELSEQGMLMQWVHDARALDQLLAKPQRAPVALKTVLQAQEQHIFSRWMLAKIEGKSSKGAMEAPWRKDDRTLVAFRILAEDLRIEQMRRLSEKLWLSRKNEIVGKKRGRLVDEVLRKSFYEGKLVFLQLDREDPLHSGRMISHKQACLKVDWCNYLSSAHAVKAPNISNFLEQIFVPGILRILKPFVKDIFLDSFTASGCLIRGIARDLLMVSISLRQEMQGWYEAMNRAAAGSRRSPSVSMCICIIGEWRTTQYKDPEFGQGRLTFSLSLAQASAGIQRNESIGQLILMRDKKLELKALGLVRVEKVENKVLVLYNAGIALTATVLYELITSLEDQLYVHEYHLSKKQVQEVLPGVHLPETELKIVTMKEKVDIDPRTFVFVKVGKPLLAGVSHELYELLDFNSDISELILSRGIQRWVPFSK
ncbi:MAG: hypothetical protein Q9M28_08770 [Mariprofundaceae bacterium]|nr:hypothetical protein [Mariprofundaceae bacterium]